MDNIQIKGLTEEYEEYLRDESRKTGYAKTISFPTSEGEIVETMKYCCEKGIPVTVQGSRTGVGAAAVPFGGHVLNLERMKKMYIPNYEATQQEEDGGRRTTGPGEPDEIRIVAEPGVTLKEIHEYVKQNTKDHYFFPPDPTETTASAGGMISCNSSGARTYFYGPVRNYVKRIKVVFADGTSLDIPRGHFFANGRDYRLQAQDHVFEGKLPFYLMPSVKNAAGYFVNSRMDLIDLFIGSEGTLGVITEAEFRLIPKPKVIWGVVIFFREKGKQEKPEAGIRFAKEIRASRALIQRVLSIEYFDKGSLELLRQRKRENPKSLPTPAIGEDCCEAVFLEVKGDSQEDVLEALDLVRICIDTAGGRPEDTWVAMNDVDFEAFKQLRHATPECVNARISDLKKTGLKITKLGSDMAVRDDRLEDVVRMYRRDLEKGGFWYVMFGHIGNNHLHVNIISRSEEEYSKGKALFARWASIVSAWNGSVSAEHGVGKLKKEYLLTMYGSEFVGQMRKLKRVFDEKGLLGRDNVFDWKESDDI